VRALVRLIMGVQDDECMDADAVAGRCTLMRSADFTAPRVRCALALVAVVALISACSGGSGNGPPPDVSVSPDNISCTGSCATPTSLLTVTDVQNVIARAAAEAQARNAAATIAVVDRVGNVLAIFQMNGAASSVTVRSTAPGQPPIVGGLEGVSIIPAAAAAIAKAVTGAYLSSEGNAFSTRTASQIVQSHFNPGEFLAPSGPLSGVQFSSLPCSDLTNRFNGMAPGPGPQRSPLGLSADPGGLPLYKGGTPVGAVGVVADGVYTLDSIIQDIDSDLDEAIALAATFGLSAPNNRRADAITVDGKILRFSDATLANMVSDPNNPPAFSAVVPALGNIVPVIGYFNGVIQAGTAFGQAPSGIRPDVLDFPGLDAFVLVDANNTERFRPRAGTEVSGALSAAEVQAVLASALNVANTSRAQIRAPQSSQMRVTISVVDSNGVILGIARTRDAPVFGIDVSLQKARAAAFFSNALAGTTLMGLPDTQYVTADASALQFAVPLGSYVSQVQTFLGIPTALMDGQLAFSDRSIGAIARPFSPDGVDGNPAGPLAKPAGQWSPFSTGVQLDLVFNALVRHVSFVLSGGAVPDVPQNCTGIAGAFAATPLASINPYPGLANGIQIFPGSVPIFRGTQLVGAVGVSGDGVDQDDMVGFLGLQRAAMMMGTMNQAPAAMRADTLAPSGPQIRYVSCPQAPFLNSDQQEPCGGF
jgi:uncharacterized protein GlcG (DUF336 family)